MESISTVLYSVLLIDIGNSTTQCAVYDGTQFYDHACFETKILTQTQLQLRYPDQYKKVISSVVPAKNKLFQQDPAVMMVTAANIPDITINCPNKSEIGADRLVNALAAYHLTQTDTLVIDSGTATTCCYVDRNGVYQGGAILPGLGIASRALHDYTAKIPYIQTKARDELFGKTTKDAVQIGLYRSHLYTLNGFIADYRYHIPGCKVVATGTAIRMYEKHIDIDLFEPELIFKGLACCIKLNPSIPFS